MRGSATVREKFFIGDTPVIIHYPRASRRVPMVILSHGFTGTKESFEKDLEFYAHRGLLALAMDNAGHGERAGPNFKETAFSEGRLDILCIRKMIESSSRDVPRLIDRLAAACRIDDSRVAIAGVSMGGYICFRALTLDPRIKVASVMVASPVWEDLPLGIPLKDDPEPLAALRAYSDRRSPDRFVERFFDRRLLIQLGGIDTHFSAENVRRFVKRVQDSRIDPGEIKLIEHPGVAHTCTVDMEERTKEWILGSFSNVRS